MKRNRLATLAALSCTLATLAACNPEYTTKDIKEASAKRCKEDYGFKVGTDAYGNCRLQLERDYYAAMQGQRIQQSNDIGRSIDVLDANTRVNKVRLVP